MTAVQTNGRAEYYLKIIGVLICILIGLLSYLTVTAIEQNSVAHAEIKRMITAMSSANGARIKALDERFTSFVEKAPPRHIHLKNGGVSRVVEE